MLGLLLRSELFQSSAVRTWNCVSNFAHFVWFKLNNLRFPEMPRSRRRHHSRSRSRSHSHDRDREAKRRRVESPDSAHHRRSVSVDSDVPENHKVTEETKIEDIPKEIENVKFDTEQKKPEEDIDTTQDEDNPNESPRKEDKPKEKCSEEENKESSDEDCIMISPESPKDNKSEEETDLNDTLPDSSKDEKNDAFVTPKKDPKHVKKDTSSKKKNPEDRQKAKEERERKRLEEKELKEKQRLTLIEQKNKEKQDKIEQKKKEKIEKEEQKRKDKEEKEAQKIKEREEKEALKIKEREEKEAQKIKEREEKEAQKQKEKEEKEEQKRKEREEKELKRQQDLVKDKKKMEKESAAFVNFFVTRKSTSNMEVCKKTENIISNFMPFQIKIDMRLAPSTRLTLTNDTKSRLLQKMSKQDEKNLYLSEIKTKTLGKSTKTWPVDDTDEVIVLEDTEIGECLEEQPIKNVRMKAKFLHFHENRRPAYFGTWRKTSQNVKPRNPLGIDKEVFDYEVDSDDDWEEEEPGESIHGSEDEDKEEEKEDDYEVDNEFFVPHGYLSDEEAENEEPMELTPETQKEKLKILQLEFEEEMKSKTERIKPRLIGCIWESKLKPKVQDAISAFLEERMMIINAPIIIKKRELKESQNTGTKNSTPTRKILSKEFIPEFLRMVHGNSNNKIFLINEFLNYLSNQQQQINVSKAALTSQLKELATWKKCPEEGAMFNKHCWYVNEDIRKQYNVNLVLPNKWVFSDESIAKKKLSL